MFKKDVKHKNEFRTSMPSPVSSKRSRTSAETTVIALDTV
jgi:hypothetical protein